MSIYTIPVIQGPKFTGLKNALMSSNQKLLGIQSTGALLTVMDTSSAGVESTDWTKELDISSYSYGAKIKLTNAGAATRTISEVTVRGAPVIQLQGEEGIIHDSLRDNGDIFENGERRIDWGNDSIVSTTQAEKVADYLWKDYGSAKHLYVLDLPGTRYDLEPDDWYNLEIGGAGQIEYIDSSVRVMSVETERGADELGRTRLVLREVEEAWKNDSSALARFVASGDFRGMPASQATITIGSQYFTGKADVYCTGTADEVLINKQITRLSNVSGGGTIKLTDGKFNTVFPIAMKSNVILSGSGDKTIINYTLAGGFDYGIEAVGVSGSELVNIGIRDMRVDSDGGAPAGSILFDYVDDSYVQNILFTTSPAHIYCTNCDRLNILDIRNSKSGLSSTRFIYLFACTLSNIANCIFDCNSRGLAEGIYVYGSSVNIANVNISNVYNPGNSDITAIYVEGSDCNLVNCNIADIHSDFAGRYGRGIYVTGDGNSISNCSVTDVDSDDTAANSRGIEIVGDNNTLGGIFVSGCSGTGILIQPTADRTQISSGRSTNNGNNFTDGGTNTTAEVDDN